MDKHGRKIIKSIEKCTYSDSESNSHDDDANKNINSNNTYKSCEVISKLLLPDDLIFDILTFVTPNCLINTARYVCKLWDATIRSSHFVEASERRKNSKPCLYVDNLQSEGNSYLLKFNDDVNDHHFERIDLGIPEKFGHVIDSCDGILLLKNLRSEIFLVNPILKCWLRIPPPPRPHFEVINFPFTIARVPHTTKFKLFHVKVDNVSGDILCIICYVLRIGIEKSWKEIARKEAYSYGDQLLYNGGNELYWIRKTEVIVMDVDKEIIVRHYPPSPPPMFCREKYLWMRNHLSCIAYKDSRYYQIYILDFDSGKWSIYHEIGPFDSVTTHGHELIFIKPLLCFRFWINDQIILRVPLQDPFGEEAHFCYNVKTRHLTRIEDIDVGHFEVWLHTNSLVLLPNSSA